MFDPATAFTNVKKSGTGWIAKCPSHDDRKASLSIGLGDAGKILLKCHAGCDLDAILAAAHLEHADLFPEKPATKASIVATYPYRDEKGFDLFDVVRFEPKDFRQRRSDGVWKMHGVRRVLYHLDELQGQPVAYIAEGEKDVDRLQAIGLPATCNSGGAGKWKPEYTKQLKAASVEHVVILPDHDEPGQKHAADVAQSCHRAGLQVKLVLLPDLPAKGDVSDWLNAGHTKVELVALVKATPLYVPTAVDSTLAPTSRHPIVTFLHTVTPEDVDWIWRGRFARGKYTLIAGEPGVGKTCLATDCSARISRGGRWPDGTMAAPGKVLYLTAEDGIADTIRPRVDAMGGDPSKIAMLEAVRDTKGQRTSLSLVRDLDMLAAAIREVEPSLVIIDPITAYLGQVDTHRDSEVRSVLAPLIDLITERRCALGAIGHLSKDAQRAALHRPGGSIAFVAAARIVLAVAADPNDLERRLLAPIKGNICRAAAVLACRITDAGALAWEADAVVGADVEALFRPSTPGEREERTDAEHVIADLLGDETAWPIEAKRALEAGQAHGIPERTMRYTARRLGIRIAKLGFAGKWMWHRPEPATIAATFLEHPNVAASAPSQICSEEGANNNEEAIKSAFARARVDEVARDRI
jgi:putative DNA primase/helicase